MNVRGGSAVGPARIDPAQASYDQALRVFWSLVAFVIGVVMHELGHAAMAWRAGLPIRMIRIEAGGLLLQW